MKAESAKLIECFNFVDNVPASTIIESSQYVFLEAKGDHLVLNLSGLLSARASMSCEGEVNALIDRRALGAFLGKTKEFVTCEASEKGIILRSGNARLEAAQPKESGDYTSWEPGQGHKLKLEGNLGLLSEYAKANPGEPHMEVVCFSKGFGAFATDSLVVAACLDPNMPKECLLPRYIANLAGKLNAEELWVEKSGVAIRNSLGWIYQPLPATDAAYPSGQVKEVIGNITNQPGFLTVGASALLDALNPFNNYAWAGDSLLSVQCIPSKKIADSLRLKLDTPTVKFEHSVSVKITGKTPEKWGWPVARILPWLEFVKIFDAEITVGETEYVRWFRCIHDSKEYYLAAAQMD